MTADCQQGWSQKTTSHMSNVEGEAKEGSIDRIMPAMQCMHTSPKHCRLSPQPMQCRLLPGVRRTRALKVSLSRNLCSAVAFQLSSAAALAV